MMATKSTTISTGPMSASWLCPIAARAVRAACDHNAWRSGGVSATRARLPPAPVLWFMSYEARQRAGDEPALVIALPIPHRRSRAESAVTCYHDSLTDHHLGGLDDNGHLIPGLQAEALRRSPGDCGGYLLSADIDHNLGHYVPQPYVPDRPSQLITRAQLHPLPPIGLCHERVPLAPAYRTAYTPMTRFATLPSVPVLWGEVSEQACGCIALIFP